MTPEEVRPLVHYLVDGHIYTCAADGCDWGFRSLSDPFARELFAVHWADQLARNNPAHLEVTQ